MLEELRPNLGNHKVLVFRSLKDTESTGRNLLQKNYFFYQLDGGTPPNKEPPWCGVQQP
jgi:hypothetical protein